MNFGIFLLILYIFLIHCNFVLPAAGKIESSKDDGATKNGHHGHAKRNGQKQEIEKEDKFPTYLMPESLEWIFSLMEWVAKEWPNLAKQPNIVEEMPRVIEKMREKSVRDMAQFVVHIRNNHVVHGEYPNTKEMTFLPILEKLLNEVDNTESEIIKGLADERLSAGENENEKQKRDKNDFLFDFMVECIYAAHMDADGNIKYGEIAEKLFKPTVNFVAYPNVAAHPLHGIVTKCAEKEVIHAFLTLMLDRFCEEQNSGKGKIDEYFYGILQRFRETGKDIITKEAKALKELGKSASLYFPERLPKLHNLACLVNTLIGLVKAIIRKLRPPTYLLASDVQVYAKMFSNVYAIFTEAIDRLTDIRRFIYFTIRNGPHYTEALNRLANNEIKEKMRKITHEDSFFVSNSSSNLRPMYREWDNEKNVHMIHYLALHSFGFTQQELPNLPKDMENAYAYFSAGQKHITTLEEKIANKIVGQFRSKMEKSYEFYGKSEAELNDLIFHQIKLNLFCVGVQEVTKNPQQYKNYDDFQKDFRLHMMDLLKTETDETGYIKQSLNWAVDHIGPYFGHQQKSPTDSDEANKILNEMGMDEPAKGKA